MYPDDIPAWFAHVEFHIPAKPGDTEGDALGRLVEELNKQEFDWALTDVEFEPYDQWPEKGERWHQSTNSPSS